MTWSTVLPHWPTGSKFDQLTAPVIDGDTPPGPNAQLDCGPTCISAITYWSTGVYLPPDSILDAMKGNGYTGPTSTDDLTGYLLNSCSTPTTVYYPTDFYSTAAGSLLNLEWQATVNGHPAILLRWWNRPASGYRHWAVCVGLTPTTASVYDPWSGTIITEDYATHSGMFLGTLITVNRGRDPFLG